MIKFLEIDGIDYLKVIISETQDSFQLTVNRALITKNEVKIIKFVYGDVVNPEAFTHEIELVLSRMPEIATSRFIGVTTPRIVVEP